MEEFGDIGDLPENFNLEQFLNSDDNQQITPANGAIEVPDRELEDCSLLSFPELFPDQDPSTSNVTGRLCCSSAEEDDLQMTFFPSTLFLNLDSSEMNSGQVGEDLTYFQPAESKVSGWPAEMESCVHIDQVVFSGMEEMSSPSVDRSTTGKDTTTSNKIMRRQKPVSVEEKKERRKESNRKAAERYRQKQKETAETAQMDRFRIAKENKQLKQLLRSLQRDFSIVLGLCRQHSAICPLRFVLSPTLHEDNNAHAAES